MTTNIKSKSKQELLKIIQEQNIKLNGGNRNRLHNCTNPCQTRVKKVLCVCSAGLLRSPTAAVVLSKAPYNFNTRAVGVDQSHALVPIDEVLYAWADDIVCMEEHHKTDIEHLAVLWGLPKKSIHVLDVRDLYDYRDKKLVAILKYKLKKVYNG